MSFESFDEPYPEHVRILQMSFGITLLGMNEVGELRRVAQEENFNVCQLSASA